MLRRARSRAWRRGRSRRRDSVLRESKVYNRTIDDPPPPSGNSVRRLAVNVVVLTDPNAADHQFGMRQSPFGAVGKFESTTRYLTTLIARGGSNREGDFVSTKHRRDSEVRIDLR